MFEGKDVKVVLANAGAGKTTYAVKDIMNELKTHRPEELAFVTFTRKGAEEGLRRVCSKFMLEPDDLPYFRTLHSLTFHALNYKANQMFGLLDQRRFNKEYGYNVNRVEADTGKVPSSQDSKYLAFYDLERSGALTSKQLAEADIEYGYYRQLVQNYEEYKSRQHLVDFFDCLIKYVQDGVSLPCKIVYVDECFSPSTKVCMADMSTKEIKDIKVGEFVMGTKGATKVTAVHKGTDTMYDVKSLKGDLIFTCNSKHLIQQYTGYITDEWKHAEDLCNDHSGVYVNRFNCLTKQKATWGYVQVIPKYIGEYVGITVDADDHLFLLANGAVVHNCQDITALQWKVIDKAFCKAEKIILLGDDKQSIYHYSGARPDILINLSKQFKVEHLSMSYRLPRKVYNLANAITSFIGEKTEQKSVFREENPEGSITQLSDISRLANFIDSDKIHNDPNNTEWYILARNNCFLEEPKQFLEDRLIPYWTSDGFFMGGQIMKRLKDYEGFRLSGYKDDKKKEDFQRRFGIADFSVPFTETNLFTEGRKWVYASYIEKYGLDTLQDMCKWNPQILVSTIHHVKGSEARNVAIMLDTTRRTKGNVFNDIDEELRVLYVGITRTKENLFLIDSKNGNGYDNIIQVIKKENKLDW